MRQVRRLQRDRALDVVHAPSPASGSGSAYIRSRLMLSKPASCASFTARSASRLSWMRPRRCRQPSSKLWMPKLSAVHARGAVALEAAVLGGARDCVSSVISAPGREAQPRAGRLQERVDRLRREQATACRRRRTRCARCGPTPAAGPARGRRPARRRTRRTAARRVCSCELKSQYGHLRTHHGMWTYSDSGGGRAASRRSRRVSQFAQALQRSALAQRAAAMADAVLQSPARVRRRARPSAGSKNTGS